MTTPDGAPASATIRLYPCDQLAEEWETHAKTDRDGSYAVDVPLPPAAGSDGKTALRVFARAREGVAASAFVGVVAGGEYDQDFVVGLGRLSGRVTDRSGHPVAGLTVRAGKPGAVRRDVIDGRALERRPEDEAEGWNGEAITDAEGRFEMRGLNAEQHPLFSASPVWFVLPGRSAAPGRAEVEVVVVPALSVSGSVVEAGSRRTVEAWVTVDVHDATGTHTSGAKELGCRTQGGRFSVMWPASEDAGEESTRASLRALPEPPEYVDSEPRDVRIEKGGATAVVELAVERKGACTLVVTATTPSGGPFEGPLQIRLVPKDGRPRERQVTVERESDGRHRIPVPAHRPWTACIEPDLPEDEKGCYATRNVSVRGGAEEEVAVSVVLPGMGSIRARLPKARCHSVELEALDVEGAAATTFILCGGEPREGDFVLPVSEGRWRVKGPPGVAREVVVSEGETVEADLR